VTVVTRCIARVNKSATIGDARRLARSETDSVTRISPGGFTRSYDFHDLTSPQAVIPRHRVGKLHSR